MAIPEAECNSKGFDMQRDMLATVTCMYGYQCNFLFQMESAGWLGSLDSKWASQSGLTGQRCPSRHLGPGFCRYVTPAGNW